MALITPKYFPWKQILNFFAFFSRRERVVMAIRPVLRKEETANQKPPFTLAATRT
jgi:hypothetical protein